VRRSAAVLGGAQRGSSHTGAAGWIARFWRADPGLRLERLVARITGAPVMMPACGRFRLVPIKDLLLPYFLTARRLLRDRPAITELAWSRERSFSQFGEDLFLRRHFDGLADSFYVDVGALHPFQFSNTFLLYKRGWRGINIEPSPDGAAAFRRYRPRDINLDVAISSSGGDVRFRLAGPFAGIDDEHLASRSVPAESIVVPTRTLASVLDEHAADTPIDLLDVDCEDTTWTSCAPTTGIVTVHGLSLLKPIPRRRRSRSQTFSSRLATGGLPAST
jgi:FkbM family methyltransferase